MTPTPRTDAALVSLPIATTPGGLIKREYFVPALFACGLETDLATLHAELSVMRKALTAALEDGARLEKLSRYHLQFWRVINEQRSEFLNDWLPHCRVTFREAIDELPENPKDAKPRD